MNYAEAQRLKRLADTLEEKERKSIGKTQARSLVSQADDITFCILTSKWGGGHPDFSHPDFSRLKSRWWFAYSDFRQKQHFLLAPPSVSQSVSQSVTRKKIDDNDVCVCVCVCVFWFLGRLLLFAVLMCGQSLQIHTHTHIHTHKHTSCDDLCSRSGSRKIPSSVAVMPGWAFYLRFHRILIEIQIAFD